jgi:hypothetical protein
MHIKRVMPSEFGVGTFLLAELSAQPQVSSGRVWILYENLASWPTAQILPGGQSAERLSLEGSGYLRMVCGYLHLHP